MPKIKNRQRWDEYNASLHRKNCRFDNNEYFENNMRQNYCTNTYFDSSIQRNVAQSYTNFDPRYQNDTRQYNNNLNASTSNSYCNTNFQRNFTQNGQRNVVQNNEYRNRNHDKKVNSVGLNYRYTDQILQRKTHNNKFIKNYASSNISFQGNIANSSNSTIDQNLQQDNSKTNRDRDSFYNNNETEFFNEKGYIVKEFLYRDPSLFYGNNDVYDQSTSNETNNDWTDTFWQKHEDTGVAENSQVTQHTGKVPKQKQNSLERTLNNMLAKPAEMSKGKSLLEKMGWLGGGLGRGGDGIVEPIAPKATYAVKTIGLGHLTEKAPKPKKPIQFSQIANKKLKKPEFQTNFHMNVLLYILNFVKNDGENKIVFEPRLQKLERKKIHQLVEKIRMSDDLNDFECMENFTDKHLDVVKEIWIHSSYELWTESEGEGQFVRRLCLFKQAPAHVYLVTPDDLAENDEPTDEIQCIDDENDINNDKVSDHNAKQEKKTKNKLSIVKKSLRNNEKKDTLASIISDGDNNINLFEELDTKMEVNDARLKSNNNINPIVEANETEINAVGKENPSFETDKQDLNYIFEDNKITKTNIVNSETMKLKSEINVDSCDEIKPKLDGEECHKIEKQFHKNEEDVMAAGNRNQNFVGDEMNTINIVNLNCDEIKLKINVEGSMEVEKPDQGCIGVIKSENVTNTNYCTDIKPKLENEEDTVNNGEEDSVLRKIVKYLKEFLEDAVFKEFRFLGPFNSEELMNVNLFFDICTNQYRVVCDEQNDLLKLFSDNCLEVLEDNNGKKFIHKVAARQSALKREECTNDVMCID